MLLASMVGIEVETQEYRTTTAKTSHCIVLVPNYYRSQILFLVHYPSATKIYAGAIQPQLGSKAVCKLPTEHKPF